MSLGNTRLRVIAAAVGVGLVVGSCSSPTAPVAELVEFEAQVVDFHDHCLAADSDAEIRANPPIQVRANEENGRILIEGRYMVSSLRPQGAFTSFGNRFGQRMTLRIEFSPLPANLWPGGALCWEYRAIVGVRAPGTYRVRVFQPVFDPEAWERGASRRDIYPQRLVFRQDVVVDGG